MPAAPKDGILPAPLMKFPLRKGAADVSVVLTLLATSVVIAWPILHGGYLTYVDNAPHLAEVYELAENRGNGWSELAFSGFSLATLHSPLWYGALAFLTRLGVPAGPLYAGVLVLAFAAPALAVYAIARRRVGAFLAAIVAYFVLIQAPMITGIGSPLGGMWTHALAVAFAILLTDLYCRPELDTKEHVFAVVLLALVALTHLFALVAALFIIGLATFFRGRGAALSRREFHRRAIGYAIAAAISADYWLTFALTTHSDAAPMDTLDPSGLACRLFLPCDVMYLLDRRLAPAVRWDLHLTDAIPMIAVLAAGVIGSFKKYSALRASKKYPSARDGDPDLLGRIGFQLGCVVFVSVLIHRFVTIAFLGPVSWRLLLWVPLGFAMSTLRWLAKFRDRRPPVPVVVALALSAIALGAWWGLPLRNDMPADIPADMATLKELSTWLADHAERDWGRIYLQDTFGQRWGEAGLNHSHVLVLTARETRLPQLGTYYGVVPYRTRWTLSEFNALYGQWHPTAAAVIEGMEKTNAGILVSSNRRSAEWIAKSGKFSELHRIGRYTVFRRTSGSTGYVDGLRPSNRISAVDFHVGRVAFNVDTEFPRGRVLIKTTWHPWWRLSGIPGGRLIESPEGFLVVDRIPLGNFHVRVWYERSLLPLITSLLGVVVLIGLMIASRISPRVSEFMAVEAKAR